MAIRALRLVVVIALGALAGEVRGDGPALIANPSFEEPDVAGAAPRGWHFHGPTEAASGAWTADTPFREKRALRIDARHRTQRWESDAIAILPGQKYLLQW